jgi:serine/threonine protein kinase
VNLIGRQIGSYIVERELGAGGTGTVYLCSHTMIDRKVAVKVLHDDLAYQPDQVARFFQEAKAAADIGHPNIVVIIDFGELKVENGTRSYLMMECLDGASLDKMLRTESFTLDQIAHILAQICSALAASHGKGIIHRDLKPANVQLCPRSFDPYFVKLLDFGIAKLATPSPDQRRTQYGVIIGTPAYMSPEQCEGKGAMDHRSDIYSLGVMLYEMLTGTVPFDGEIRDILTGHLMVPPPPLRERNPAVPPEWEALCMHMMEKSRDARFQSVSEIAQVLFDLPRHASAYSAYVAARASRSQSGFTMKLDAPDDPTSAASRPTLHVGLDSGLAVASRGAWSPETGPHTDASAPAAGDPHGQPSVQYFSPAQLAALASMPPLASPPLATSSYPQPQGDDLGAPPGPPPAHGAAPYATGAHGAAPYATGAHGAAPYATGAHGAAPYVTGAHAPAPLDVAPSAPATSLATAAAPAAPRGDGAAGMAACYALVTEPRHHAFLATLLVRPPGRWFNVAELCGTSNTAPPATLPPQPLFCAWLEPPWADPAMAAVVFISLADGSNTVALCRRVSW